MITATEFPFRIQDRTEKENVVYLLLDYNDTDGVKTTEIFAEFHSPTALANAKCVLGLLRDNFAV